MRTVVRTMDDEVRRLRAALAALPHGHGRRYSTAFQARIADITTRLRSAGMGWQRIGEVLGIPHETVRRFARATGIRAFRPVVVETEPSPAGVLVAPSGHRVEGLSVADLATLLRHLQ